MGCVPQTWLEWFEKQGVDRGQRDGLTTSERERIQALEREVKELRQANDILKTASAFFAPPGSTADSSPEGVHRPTPGCLRGRADLQGIADGPVVLPAPCGAAAQPAMTLRPRQAWFNHTRLLTPVGGIPSAEAPGLLPAATRRQRHLDGGVNLNQTASPIPGAIQSPPRLLTW
ncbi:MAG: hypothetical protein OHK0048_25690 [Rhodoferax sp.]